MAKAEKLVVNDYNVVLTLNKHEAETLLAVTGKIGGTPENTRRRFVDSIRRAMLSAGVQEVAVKTGYPETYNGVWFTTEIVNG
jgi:hypothetical protein